MPDITINISEYVPLSLTFTGKKTKIAENDVRNLIDNLEQIRDNLVNVKKNKALMENDMNQIDNFLETLNIMIEKYKNKHNEIKKENAKINIFNTFINEYQNNYEKRITDEQVVYSDFIAGKDKTINAIANLINEECGLMKYSPSDLEVNVIPETNPVDKYMFVSKIGMEKIDKKYIINLINSVLKKNKRIDTLSITEIELEDWIKNNNTECDNQINALKSKIDAVLDKDFEPRNSIVESGMDVYQNVSSGFDAQMYFTLISGETNDKGIYIVDQPEDHISQKAIKEKVLKQFRRMGGNRQVIMVTHNPQFIINLDVDNVIFLSDENGKFVVKSGALEYEDEDYSVLDIVAENVEGGLAQIQGRLKRYEKKLYTK